MEGEIKNLIKIWLTITASLCYCYFIPSRIPKGKYRLLSLLPIFSLFTILPLHLTYVFPTVVVATAITWLANFKLLLFSFDLGPLSSNPPKSLPLFITLACLPSRITNQNHNHPFQNPNKPRKLALNLAIEVVFLAILMGFLHDYRDSLQHEIVLVLLYCLVVFLLVDILFAVSNVVVWLGLEVEPPSDEPYLATSLQDFWGRRWNLTVTNTLRHTIHKPVWAATVGVLGRQWAQIVGGIIDFSRIRLNARAVVILCDTWCTPHVGDDRVFRASRGMHRGGVGCKEGVSRPVAVALGNFATIDCWVRGGY